ncbi:hypothetical protein ACERK3_18770 [Phycisphaerales bacterium AB-hyl4]|uniref:WD40 repeat protein n=1 Tax=Natronomicrosphaera hydrolytica TaxID=3242702 RepID=A0ABV4U9N6_9BACT
MAMALKHVAFPVPDRWCVHGYYTLCPYAPDDSGRIVIAGADLDRDLAEVIILSAEGDVLDRFGRVTPTASFWHTGLWQSWSPDARFIYYQSGSLQSPRITRHELATGRQVTMEGDVEGVPPSGEPAISCSHGLLYAAGYGDGQYKPQQAPVPFQARDRHGMSQLGFDPPHEQLVLSTQQILDRHPQRDRLLEADREIRSRLGKDDGLTLMTYCVRWNQVGSRFLFYFGNHCVVKDRGEPRLAYVFTADRDMKDIHLALDLSFGRRGVHWGWQPDNEHLIGYGPHPDDPGRSCLAEVRYDGTGYRMLSEHHSGGHPSVSPADRDLIVTDEGTTAGGAVLFISRSTGAELARVALPKFVGDREPAGRNAQRICHHPVFSHDGTRVLFNTLPGREAVLGELALPEGKLP